MTRNKAGKLLHAACIGSGEGGAVVFTLDKHALTNVQQACYDQVFKDFHQILMKRFLGLEPFLYPAPVGKKMVFNGNRKDGYYFSEYRPIDEELGNNIISTTPHGSKEGNDLVWVPQPKPKANKRKRKASRQPTSTSSSTSSTSFTSSSST